MGEAACWPWTIGRSPLVDRARRPRSRSPSWTGLPAGEGVRGDALLQRKRYQIRADGLGWTVFDVFTGQAVVIHDLPQTGLKIEDAVELANLLDDPTAPRRRIWQ